MLLSIALILVKLNESTTTFFYGGRDFNPEFCMYYALSISTKQSSRRPTTTFESREENKICEARSLIHCDYGKLHRCCIRDNTDLGTLGFHFQNLVFHLTLCFKIGLVLQILLQR